MSRRKNTFNESAFLNNATYILYYNRLAEMALSMFEWKNLPETVDARFIEVNLFNKGNVLFFKDDVLGFLCLPASIGGQMNVYNIPTVRQAYASNGYKMTCDEKNSVIIYNNLIRSNSVSDVEMYARRIYNLDRAIDVNANAQKTPLLIQCEETQKLTMKNLYQQYDGNAPIIFAKKSLDTDGLTVLKTDAPYVADKLYELKSNIWNEALTYLGISNITDKKERMIVEEVARNQGGTIASRFSRLESRKQACEQINRMFDLNIDVEYRDDFKEIVEAVTDTEGGFEDE